MTWPYRETVLDLEPHGPLPSQIYWRRRGLALGIAVLVIGIIAAVAFTVFGGSDSKSTVKNDAVQSQVPQPENKTPVVAPAGRVDSPADPDGDGGGGAAADPQGG